MMAGSSSLTIERERYAKFQFTHSFDVTQFEACPFNDRLYSPEFRTIHNKIGFTWSIHLNPNGNLTTDGKEYRGHIGVFLKLQGNGDLRQQVRAKWAVFVDVNGNRLREFRIHEHEHKYSESWGVLELLTSNVANLRRQRLISPCEKLKVGVTMEIPESLFEWKDILRRMEENQVVTRPSESTICPLFDKILVSATIRVSSTAETPIRSDGTYPDLFIVTGDEKTIKCHRFILSERNEYFHAMLESDFTENRENRVTVMYDIPTMMEILHYIYRDSVSEKFKDLEILPILDAANQYGVTGLKFKCEKRMIEELEVRNSADLLVLAETYSLKVLREMTLNLVSKNQWTVGRSSGGRRMSDGLWDEVGHVSELRIRVFKIPW